ncbi:hypothetical protein VPHG_00160 [Vibrio phage 11895-B1]|uniref:hypothetical protein n=1 Tax=Vibrio phage 11895-B1 TaxID=754075 RepID=UPI0002C0F093|nr:hypothetical protein VPHG_00160 [Vibrio phage 11895-B1]AGH32223.1 hypothetical protein VPHG_00160 [Vibrio phage 11895-B1]
MPMCTCGQWYSGNYGELGKYDIDACPDCKAASTPETYVNSFEWCLGHTTEDTQYNPEQNDN